LRRKGNSSRSLSLSAIKEPVKEKLSNGKESFSGFDFRDLLAIVQKIISVQDYLRLKILPKIPKIATFKLGENFIVI
jgi:hypothetical protein